MLRVSPLLDRSPPLAWCVVALGLITAVYAAVAARVQTDIKSVLSFACMTQVGIIFVEIGLGFRYLALVHIIGHACLRTLQFLRAPTLLRDYKSMENAVGGHLPRYAAGQVGWLPPRLQTGLYRFALQRGYLDSFVRMIFVTPVVETFRWCDRLERRWTDFLAGEKSRESDDIPPIATQWDELA